MTIVIYIMHQWMNMNITLYRVPYQQWLSLAYVDFKVQRTYCYIAC